VRTRLGTPEIWEVADEALGAVFVDIALANHAGSGEAADHALAAERVVVFAALTFDAVVGVHADGIVWLKISTDHEAFDAGEALGAAVGFGGGRIDVVVAAKTAAGIFVGAETTAVETSLGNPTARLVSVDCAHALKTGLTGLAGATDLVLPAHPSKG
jgi:hypothetical protein